MTIAPRRYGSFLKRGASDHVVTVLLSNTGPSASSIIRGPSLVSALYGVSSSDRICLPDDEKRRHWHTRSVAHTSRSLISLQLTNNCLLPSAGNHSNTTYRGDRRPERGPVAIRAFPPLRVQYNTSDRRNAVMLLLP